MSLLLLCTSVLGIHSTSWNSPRLSPKLGDILLSIVAEILLNGPAEGEPVLLNQLETFCHTTWSMDQISNIAHGVRHE